MKQFYKPFSTFLFIAIYCFGLFVSVKTLPATTAQTIEKKKKQKEYDTDVSTIFSIHFQQSENILSDFTEYESSGFKICSDDFESFLYSNELLFKTKFKQYQSYFKNLLIRNRKFDLIFPFHNFW